MPISSEITALQTNLANAKDAVTAKGGTVGNTGLAGLASEIAGIPSGDAEIDYGKDINFYDYEGTLVEAWTLAELATKTALPAQPTHEGLTADGWNWSLQGLKSLNLPMNVGALYHPTDNKNHFIIELKEGTLRPAFIGKMNLPQNATLTVEWGDGEEDSFTGAFGNNTFFMCHQYASPGTYDVKIFAKDSQDAWVTGGLLFTDGVAMDNGELFAEGVAKETLYLSHVGYWDYGYALREIWCSGVNTMRSGNTNTTLASYGNFRGIRAIIVPLGANFPTNSTAAGHLGHIPVFCSASNTGMAQKIFCYAEGSTNIARNTFVDDARSEGIITWPQAQANITTNLPVGKFECKRIIFPAALTTISGGLTAVARIFDFSTCTQVPTLSSPSWGLYTGYQILVPAALEATWKAASGWSDYANNIIGV